MKFNAVEPGYTATELGDVDHSTGQPVEVGAAVIARWASIGTDGPTLGGVCAAVRRVRDAGDRR